MKSHRESRWNRDEARAWAQRVAPAELGLRVYSSRLLGAEPELAFAGGGNTSLKATVRSLHGDAVETLFVKASGAELATVEARDFTPLELAPTLALLDLPALTDAEMMRELRRLQLDPDAAAPSVETLLHALLPFRYVEHAHPVAVLALLCSVDADRLAAELWGDDCLLVPYTKPGFDLARRCRDLWRRDPRDWSDLRGLVLLGHGLVSFADDARESHRTMLELASRAARRRAATGRRAAPVAARSSPRPRRWRSEEIARLRAAVSAVAGRPLALALRSDGELLRLLDRADLASLARRGTLTPDHVLWIKRRPLVVSRPSGIEAVVGHWAESYQRESDRLRAGRSLVTPDPAPRAVLIRGTGVVGIGRTPAEARTAATLWTQTARALARAEALGGWRPLAPRLLFEVETWEPEQAKLARAGAGDPLAGRVALVTGAASGIGRASAQALLAAGTAVVGIDLEPCALGGEFVAVVGDASSRRTIEAAIELASHRFGGLDIVIANAGVFFAGPTIAELEDGDWRRTMTINLDAQMRLLRSTIPLLRHAPAGGAIVVVGSKNVAAPGPGAAAYSASKAAVTQLARVAALELAGDGIRVNVVHPDAVFDTGVWSDGRLEARAARYGLTVDQYRRRNLLGREVASRHVGDVVAALAGDLFARTTGAQIPIDGGNDRVV